MDQVKERTVTTAEDAVRVLNEALLQDPDAVHLIFRHVPHNGTLATHPTIQVAGGPGTPVPHISALGLINGIFGVHPGTSHGLIAVVLDTDTRHILRFELTKPEDAEAQNT